MYEQIIREAKAELAACGGAVEIDLSDPRILIEYELAEAFATYDNIEVGAEFVRRLEIADVQGR